MHKLIINILIPIVILVFLSDDRFLGPLPALLLAIGLPAAYGVWDLLRRRRVDASTILGILSVVLTGVIAAFKLPSGLFAVKEAIIPLGFAALLLVSNKTDFPIVKLLFDMVQRKDRVEQAVRSAGAEDAYRAHIERCGALWAGTMAISGIMKFTLSSLIVTADAGTRAFNTQLATYELAQIPTSKTITMVMILALIWYVGKGTGRIVGLPPSQVLRGGERLAAIFARVGRVVRLSRPASS
jgi:hypothetical protein